MAESSQVGAGLSRELREWIDRVIVPALVREYVSEKKSVAQAASTMAESARVKGAA